MSLLHAPLRTGLLAAGRSPRLKSFASNSKLARPVVARFIAGSTQAEAVAATSALLDKSLLVTIDYLGEDTTSRALAAETVSAYQSLLGALAAAGLADRAEVSVKLSAIGQALPGGGEQIALDGARSICVAAAAAGTTVTLDMEDHTTTDSTLSVLAQLRVDFPWVGAVVQAYLHRTLDDCKTLAVEGSRVRLCKGAYAEPESVAYQGSAVEKSYVECLDVLMAGSGYPMIASHDPAMIAAAGELAAKYGRTNDSYEYQMLYGIRPDEQLALVASGNRMRVYVPFGTEWYGYFMRRLAERPANLKFFLRALV